MDRDVNLGRASREELIQLVGRLLDHVEALEARISELEGRQKPPTEEGKERKPPAWVKANRPDRPRKERQKRTHGFARRREEPTHRVEHATASCPGLRDNAAGREGAPAPPDYNHTPGAGAGD